MKAAGLALAALALPALAGAQDVCTRDAAPCEVAAGQYRVALPHGAAGPMPAVVFLHGYGGSGRGTLGMTGTIDALTVRGYAVIAPDGLPFEAGGDAGSWSFLPETVRPRRRDEAAFLAEVVADAADRHGVDAGRVILAGFSAGAFMVNYLACERPDAFFAYAPVSGGFWHPMPDRCAGPVRLLHAHGFADGTVPLEGRPLRDGAFVQGDVFAGLAVWRDANGCAWDDPDAYGAADGFLRRRWDCAPGAALEFALFDGGHGIPPGWARMMLDWAEALERP